MSCLHRSPQAWKVGSGKGKNPLGIPTFCVACDPHVQRVLKRFWSQPRQTFFKKQKPGNNKTCFKSKQRVFLWYYWALTFQKAQGPNPAKLISHNCAMFYNAVWTHALWEQTTNKPPLAGRNDVGLTDGDKPKWGKETGSLCGRPKRPRLRVLLYALPSVEEMLALWRLLPGSTISGGRRKVSCFVPLLWKWQKRGLNQIEKTEWQAELGWFGLLSLRQRPVQIVEHLTVHGYIEAL